MHNWWRSLFTNYGFSLLVTSVVVASIGLFVGGPALLSVLTLVALEISFSLDNAVVNAQVLQHMTPFWQRMFMTVGILIAVFGMRLVFPVVIVAVTSGLNLAEVVNLALNQPLEYAAKLESAHPTIAAFGGMFLLMIFLDFIFGEGKSRVVARLEKSFRVTGAIRYIELFLACAALGLVSAHADQANQTGILWAGLMGIATYLGVRTLSDLFATAHSQHKQVFAQAGLATFLYLELLDASFSFDGVIGAFAVTTNVLLIAVGLGVGAVWVRSITIELVKNQTLTRYPYLDLGAHIAIGALAVLLLLGINVELPDLLTGCLGLTIIATSYFVSVWHNHKTIRPVAKTGA